LKAFFNFLIDKCNLNMKNPCNTPLLSKAFKTPKQVVRRILDRESVEELIYNTQTIRDRLMVELQARCGLRIGESLKIKAKVDPKRTQVRKGIGGSLHARIDCQTVARLYPARKPLSRGQDISDLLFDSEDIDKEVGGKTERGSYSPRSPQTLRNLRKSKRGAIRDCL
jgi:site-specific recombinase XerD